MFIYEGLTSAEFAQAKPPAPGEPSHELWLKEKTSVLESFKSRAQLVADAFNKMPGFKCNEVRVRTFPTPTLVQQSTTFQMTNVFIITGANHELTM